MRIPARSFDGYPWYLRPLFQVQRRKYGAILDSALAWARSPKLFLGLSILYAYAERRGEHWLDAELLRIKGKLLLHETTINEDAAQSSFLQALEIARAQGARSLELRAATPLARLWHNQGKSVEARDLLAPVYGWFTEGFGTADLKEAKALLDELS